MRTQKSLSISQFGGQGAMIEYKLQFFGGRGSSGSRNSGGGGGAVNPDNEKALKAAYENVNPNYDPESAKRWDEYSWNCNKCVVAFEANMRGADVEALPYKFGVDTDFSDNPEKAFGLKKSDGWEMGGSRIRQRTVQNIELEMNDYGVGSRAIITYRNAGDRSGHTLNIVQTSKGTVAVDAQKGKQMTVSQALKGSRTNTVTLYRVDNQPINSDIAKRAYKPRRSK